MRILVGKVFGIGNAVMCVPMIKALKSLGHDVDVIVGHTPDDGGAKEILEWVTNTTYAVSLEDEYDLAIMSIPFDGRWQNGVHYRAKRVIDGRTRPDPSTTGLVSWQKHEVEYQMDSARELGFVGATPSCEFMPPLWENAALVDTLYLGLGYKKDAAGFWKVKHWGNERYAEVVSRLLERNKRLRIYTTGDILDLKLSIQPINEIVKNERFMYVPGGMRDSFRIVERCQAYFGNDTGMMHVAASMGKPVIAFFFLENSMTKSHPWCKEWSGIWDRNVPTDEVVDMIEDKLG